MSNMISTASPRFTFVENATKEIKAKRKQPTTSLERLIYNSEHLSEILNNSGKLKSLRFDELELLHEIREAVDLNQQKFEKIKQPENFRREIRATILPKFITANFIRSAEEKLLSELLNSKQSKDQDSLMTALVFLQSHTALELPVEDNPLWETIFNLSLRDGLQFVDMLTVLLEGIDKLKINDPELLSRDPLILQKTKQVCQFPIFWKLLIEYKEILPFEGLISSILRGEIMIELYFDELVHLPYYLFQLFKDKMNQADFLSELIPDGDKEMLATDLIQAISTCVEKDLPHVLPEIIRRLENVAKKEKKSTLKDQLQQAIDNLNSADKLANNIFVIMLIAAKISMKRYWENKRDRFFFFTILKNPVDAKNYYDYGQILIRLKKIKIAEQLFHCGVEIDAETFWGHWGLGQLFLKKDKIQTAELHLRAALNKAQKLAIQFPQKFIRELFLIKDDMKKITRKKVKNQARLQPQIELF